MMRLRNLLFAFAIVSCAHTGTAPAAAAGTAPAAAVPPRVALQTSMGRIVIELYPEKAPKTVENFLSYVRDGFYDGTIFHRIIDNLLVQAGAYTIDLQSKPTRAPIPLESNNGLSNLRGSVAAARAPSRVDSATSQFFINVVDNPRFDYRSDESAFTRGYAVFGQVIEGMEVIDAMRAVPTESRDPLPSDVPVTPIVIEHAQVLPTADQ